jgi:hypothetical protein
MNDLVNRLKFLETYYLNLFTKENEIRDEKWEKQIK